MHQDVDGDGVGLEHEDVVLVAAQRRQQVAAARVPDLERQVGDGRDHLAVVRGPDDEVQIEKIRQNRHKPLSLSLSFSLP
jgi:hypothetical protein